MGAPETRAAVLTLERGGDQLTGVFARSPDLETPLVVVDGERDDLSVGVEPHIKNQHTNSSSPTALKESTVITAARRSRYRSIVHQRQGRPVLREAFPSTVALTRSPQRASSGTSSG